MQQWCLKSQLAQSRRDALPWDQPMRAFKFAAQAERRQLEQRGTDLAVITCISPAANRSCTASSAAALNVAGTRS
jgi:hypothetical protein